MNKKKIFDCITFFDENLLVNSRFEILDNVVDYFIVCESRFDHRGERKKINFKLKNKKFEKKVRHIVIDKNFPNIKDGWQVEAYQREKILDGINDASEDDLIMYSDSDEIPNPDLLKDIHLNKKYGIFMQKFYTYKINVFNKYESPWEGTKICKKKDLSTFTHLRKKIKSKNIKKPFYKLFVQRSIQTFEQGGWHFNNLYSPEIISKKLKTFQHKEFSAERFSNINVIKKKLLNLEDLFERKHKYQKVDIDDSYPLYIKLNQNLFKDFIY